eukprot:4375877-Amphidinium_carterae.1
MEWIACDSSWSRLGAALEKADSSRPALTMVQDAFASRSLGTLRLRVGSLRDFGRSRSGVVIPFTENDAYMYVKDLEKANAAPTKAQRFVEAANFICA